MVNLPQVEVTWPAPSWVRTLVTTREGGVSVGPYASLNLGGHCGDQPLAVAQNRQRVALQVGAAPRWLKQVHGVRVVEMEQGRLDTEPEADAALTRQPGVPVAVMTADCLPLLFCHRHQPLVAAVHAGWRGLCQGVIESTVEALHANPEDLLVWLGPAIGPAAYEVGDEVRSAFVAKYPVCASEFHPMASGKWLANLYGLAWQRLKRLGVEQIYGGTECTYSDSARFFSHRRDGGTTGRMASIIWMETDS
jgi:YfiH family protein